jgi:hypothetical protein
MKKLRIKVVLLPIIYFFFLFFSGIIFFILHDFYYVIIHPDYSSSGSLGILGIIEILVYLFIWAVVAFFVIKFTKNTFKRQNDNLLK